MLYLLKYIINSSNVVEKKSCLSYKNGNIYKGEAHEVRRQKNIDKHRVAAHKILQNITK